MSAFYGMIQGNRGAATRSGSKASGYTSSCQSWDGSVRTDMWYNDKDELMVCIGLCTNGSSTYTDKTLFRGTFEELTQISELLSGIKIGKFSIVKHRNKK